MDNKSITVEEFAKKLGNMKSEILIDKLNLIGIKISKDVDKLTAEQQNKLLSLLKLELDQKKADKVISLKRSSINTIKSTTGSHVVTVIKKNRKFFEKEEISTKVKRNEKFSELNIDNNIPSSEVVNPKIINDNYVTTDSNINVSISQFETHNNNIAPPIVESQLEINNVTISSMEPSKTDNIENSDTNNNVVKKQTQVPEVNNNIENKNLEQSDSSKLKTSKNKKSSKKNSISTSTDDNDDYNVTKKTKLKSKVKGKHENHSTKINLNVLSKVVENEEFVEELEERKILSRKIKSSNKVNKPLSIKNIHAFEKPKSPIKYEIELPFTITVAELAQKMSIKSSALIKMMMKLGIIATINQSLDQETACLIVEDMGHKAILGNPQFLEDSIAIEYKCSLQSRSPIVTVMGHVDHGKTSLLDYIRSTRVTSKEAGGITQHIGAYQVPTKHHGMITFLDTPGHSAFTAMRARGANCTDIVVLVVAADDSVMPQTIEAIQHAQAASVPIIVAINKIDKPNIDVNRVTHDLAQHGIISEEWGGENIFVMISAKTGEGVDSLLESVALQAEILELKAPYAGPAQGVIIESSLDKTRGGIVATLLIQSGTLNKGDIILAGIEYGKIKSLKNDKGQQITQAGPSTPVEVLGLSYTPLAGDKFQVVFDERKAKEVAERRQNLQKEELLSRQQAIKLSGFMDKMQKNNEIKSVNIILKADVQGSLEAIADALTKLSTEQVKINIICKSVGGFNESDVNLAVASKAFLLGFNVRAEVPAKLLAKVQGKEFNYYSVIYDLINAVQAVIDGNTIVPVKEIIIGVAEVRDVFRSSKFGTVAGCLVKEGLIKRGNPIRVLRDNVVIYSGELESLRRFKENVNEVRNGMECGIGVKNYNDVKVKDQIEVFEILTKDKGLKDNIGLK